MRLNALGGLANRLRAIFSRYEPGMQVCWTRTWDVADAHFLECFQPVPGIEFVGEEGPFDEATWNAAINYADWHRHYALLRPTAALQERIDGMRDAMGPYHAMHVRRTDHVKLAHLQGRYTNDEEFLEWARARSGMIFLATDNSESREIMRRHLGARVTWQGPMMVSHAVSEVAQRYNSLQDAVVDLFLCVGATSFMKSANSSFSELVEHMRENA